MISSIYSASGPHVRIAQIVAAAIISCSAFAAAHAASAPTVKDTFITLSLPGVIGNFTQVPNAPANVIEVLSLSAGAGCFAAAGSACTNPNINSLSLLKIADDASPKLFLALVTGVTYAIACPGDQTRCRICRDRRIDNACAGSCVLRGSSRLSRLRDARTR
jgi:hypothetical protein